MIHTNRIVTVGEQESIIDRPIVLYRGDREVEIEFTLVGNEFTFSEEGNVIKSVNASHGQLVLNTPSGEHMFSELAECHEGKVVFVVTKEMIDEFIEMGFYSFQIRLYDSAEMKSRVTIPPVMNGFDIRNPIAAEDETNVVDQGIVDYARIFKDQSNEELPTFTWDGEYVKTEWAHHDVITENKMNKIEDALYSINANIKESDVVMLNALDKVKKDADKYVKEHMAEVEADVEEFERNLNTGVEKFKVDTNAAMTAHKNEVSEELEGFSSQLAHIEKIVLTPEMYGCVGDGITDDTLSFQQCINDAINKGAMINGLGKTYKISDIQQIPTTYAPAEYGLYIEGSLYLYNCNFILKSACLGKTTILNIMNPAGTNVVIDNVNINGNGENQSTDIGSQDGGLHGLRVGYDDAMEAMGGFELKNSIIQNCYSDCVCTRPVKFDFCYVHNCKIIRGGRNGFTDNSYASVIENCEFIDNGWRTPPSSGYHIEPDSSFDFGVKTMKNCNFSNSVSNDYNIHFNSRAYNVDTIYIDNCNLTTLGIAHYCAVECCIKNLTITNSTISDISAGNGADDIAYFYIENMYMNNLKGGLLSIKGPHESNKVNIVAENSRFNTIHFYKGINSAIFNNCTCFKGNYDGTDAVRYNFLYFDYDVSGDGYTTEQLTFNGCKFYNINRCIMLGPHRTFKNITLKNNNISTGHLIISQGKDINSILIDGNICKDPTGNPGTAGKIRLGAEVKYMLMSNNMYYMSETAVHGDYQQTNVVKANNIYDMVE